MILIVIDVFTKQRRFSKTEIQYDGSPAKKDLLAVACHYIVAMTCLNVYWSFVYPHAVHFILYMCLNSPKKY